MHAMKWLGLVVLIVLFAALGCDGGKDGKNGINGLNGDAGAPGTPGADGTDGVDGADGTNGADGQDGPAGDAGLPGEDGEDGEDGENGENGGNAEITNNHGTEFMESTGEFATAGKYYAGGAITAATADTAGVATVDFTVTDDEGDPLTTLTSANFAIANLAPASGDESFNKWVPYIYRVQAVVGDTFPMPDGTEAEQGYRESSSTGTFVNNLDGSYSYTFGVDLSSVVTPVTDTAITYDRSRTHRVTVMFGGHSGPTAELVYDFVPDGSAMTETRDIVETATCMKCHGPEFHGHGGDRLTVEGCVVCHTQDMLDPQSGNSIDFKDMLHKIHAGGELASIPGDDGIVWDDPDTVDDESADNGEYVQYGHNDHEVSWWKVGFPAMINNCTACHTGSGADLDNFEEVPSRAACGSCHDDVNFVDGTNHSAGAQANDDNCSGCHSATSIEDYHAEKADQDIPEFTIDLTVSTPTNGTHFVAGESPVVTIVINDDGVPIDHTGFVSGAAEGCTTDPCPDPAVAGYNKGGFMVNGPRAERNPVLIYRARALVSTATTSFDLDGTEPLEITVDNGMDIMGEGETVIPANFSVDLSGLGNGATVAEVIAALNADEDFAARAIAYTDEVSGDLAIRSRNLGKFYAVELGAGTANDAIFGGDTDLHILNNGGYTVSTSLFTDSTDPFVSHAAGAITYTLDPVDDLEPGTYAISVEIGDLGRVDATDYKTPSVAVASFQVGQADEEPFVANNCESCHWSADSDTGFVLDPSRHNKKFNEQAVDQCGGCHDYQNGHDYGGWYGGNPINRRVHAVHYGSSLNYPLTTVSHSDGIPGRDWDITFPQDVRFCEACHPDSTSGSWMTEASILPCSGCHDSDAVQVHMMLQTYDPTPADPFNGDEMESCKTCH